MSISLYSNGARHQNRWIYAFKAGLERHGLNSEVHHPDHPVETDIVITWGMHHHKVNRLNSRHIVLEAAYFRDRLEFASAGWGGLNGRADFRNQGSPSDRWEKHGVPIKKWNNGGEYILIAGQVLGDASISHLDAKAIYQNAADRLSEMARPVYFRPHPLGGGWIPNGAQALSGSLDEALEKCHCLVTINSNTSVDAALAGVPVVTLDEGSMAWDVAGHKLEDVLLPKRPDRTQWAYNLAYCQWTEDEIRNGDAWEHLNDYYA